MTARLAIIITAVSESLYRRPLLRALCGALAGAALLLFWLHSGDGEVEFVYHNF